MQNRHESITGTGRIIKRFHHQEVITYSVVHISRKDRFNLPSCNKILNSICWDCQNAVPNFEKSRGCSWSLGFKPVEGWEAVRQDVAHGDYASQWHREIESYTVINCPCFKKDEGVA